MYLLSYDEIEQQHGVIGDKHQILRFRSCILDYNNKKIYGTIYGLKQKDYTKHDGTKDYYNEIITCNSTTLVADQKGSFFVERSFTHSKAKNHFTNVYDLHSLIRTILPLDKVVFLSNIDFTEAEKPLFLTESFESMTLSDIYEDLLTHLAFKKEKYRRSRNNENKTWISKDIDATNGIIKQIQEEVFYIQLENSLR